MPGRSLGTAQSSCEVVGPPHTKGENKERVDMSGQNSLRHGVKLMEKRLRRQERLVKPRSNERSNRGAFGSAPDCSCLYVGNCKTFIKTD